MSQSAPAVTRHDIEAKIVKRCWESDAFRKEFVSDPAACFVKYLNTPKTQLPKIHVHEEQAGSWHIVLPAKPTKSGELSDDELEKIAGGTDVVLTALASALASGAVESAIATVVAGGW